MTALTRRRFTEVLLAGAVASGGAGLFAPAAAGRTIVVGGGPAGAAAALALRRARPDSAVLLIERDPAGLSGDAAARAAAPFGKPTAAIGWATLRDSGVEVALDEVVGVDWRAGRLELFSGRRPAFDRLVLAPGAAPREENLPGLDDRTRHLWPAAWGSPREARRLAALLGALPATGHVVLRLPGGPASHPDVALSRALRLAGFLARERPKARLTVLDGGPNPEIATRFLARAAATDRAGFVDWRTASSGGTVLGVDADRGALETNAGRVRADVVNFVPPQGAGSIARLAGLVDASGWCPCDAGAVSTLRPGVVIVGDARKGAQRTASAVARSLSTARL